MFYVVDRDLGLTPHSPSDGDGCKELATCFSTRFFPHDAQTPTPLSESGLEHGIRADTRTSIHSSPVSMNPCIREVSPLKDRVFFA